MRASGIIDLDNNNNNDKFTLIFFNKAFLLIVQGLHKR